MIQAFIVGILGGVMFFGGLYFTVQKLGTAKHPAVLMILSLFLRLAILTAGLYLIVDGGIRNLLSAMAGVLIVRTIMIRKFGLDTSPKKGV